MSVWVWMMILVLNLIIFIVSWCFWLFYGCWIFVCWLERFISIFRVVFFFFGCLVDSIGRMLCGIVCLKLSVFLRFLWGEVLWWLRNFIKLFICGVLFFLVLLVLCGVIIGCCLIEVVGWIYCSMVIIVLMLGNFGDKWWFIWKRKWWDLEDFFLGVIS